MNKYMSRKFLVAIFGTISYFVLEYWGIKIPGEVLALLLGYMGVEGARDIVYAVNHKEVPKEKPVKEVKRVEEVKQEIEIKEEVRPFDVKAFHESVLGSVVQSYTVGNPATIFYQARDKGTITNCQHISQAQDYWDYLVQLVLKAQEYIEGIVEKSKPVDGCKPRSPELYAMQQQVRTTLAGANALNEVARLGIDWKAKLPRHFQTLYHLGALSAEMLEHN